ncbi:hypothetical protein D3C74_458060 [compost metagenome]
MSTLNGSLCVRGERYFILIADLMKLRLERLLSFRVVPCMLDMRWMKEMCIMTRLWSIVRYFRILRAIQCMSSMLRLIWKAVCGFQSNQPQRMQPVPGIILY